MMVVLQQDVVDAASQVLTRHTPQGNQDGRHVQMNGQVHLFKKGLSMYKFFFHNKGSQILDTPIKKKYIYIYGYIRPDNQYHAHSHCVRTLTLTPDVAQ